MSFSVFFIMRLLAILLTVSCTVSGTTISRIVGGHDADENKYPYQVSIMMLNYTICGGSIITHYYILTAAHCIYKESPEEFAVVAGTNNLIDGGVRYGVNSLKWHQDYNQTLFLNDIGLIRVNRYIEFNTRIQPISLPSVYYVPIGETAIVTGWGRLNYNSSRNPDLLQELKVNVVSQELCEQTSGQETKNNICTFTRRHQGVCFGDSGGPLVSKDKQIGVVSYGNPCGFGYLDVYTRVFPYKNWITNVTSIGVETNPNTWTVLLFTLSTIIPYIHPLS